MGTQASKIENNANARKRRAKQSQDDGQSKSTELTEESSLPRSPTMAHFPSNASARSLRRQPEPTSSRALSRSTRSQNEASAAQFRRQQRHALARLDSQTSEVSRTAPVKCPPKRDMSAHYESDDEVYLAKMYDTRTWEMYRRITEARKNSSYGSHCGSQMDNTRNENTPEWENLQHDLVDSSPSGHEMIFLFDFD